MIELDRLRKSPHHLLLLYLLFLLLQVPAACTVPQTGLLLAGAQTGLLGQPFLDLPPVHAVLQSGFPLSISTQLSYTGAIKTVFDAVEKRRKKKNM